MNPEGRIGCRFLLRVPRALPVFTEALAAASGRRGHRPFGLGGTRPCPVYSRTRGDLEAHSRWPFRPKEALRCFPGSGRRSMVCARHVTWFMKLRRCAWRLPNAAALSMTLLTVLVTSGCVQRRLTIRSNPPGARVYVGDEEIGTTPVSTDFVYYGTRKIRLVKDGYETLVVNQPIPTPWYQIPPLDFVSENLVPGEIRDERVVNYQLVPLVQVPSDQLLGRAEQLRADSRIQPGTPVIGVGTGLPGAAVPPPATSTIAAPNVGLPPSNAPAAAAPSQIGPSPLAPISPLSPGAQSPLMQPQYGAPGGAIQPGVPGAPTQSLPGDPAGAPLPVEGRPGLPPPTGTPLFGPPPVEGSPVSPSYPGRGYLPAG